MPRIIPIGPNVQIVRRRCHVGHAIEFQTLDGTTWRTTPVKDPTLRAFINFASRMVALDERQGDDPILVEHGSPEAAALPKCCAPSARVYLHEADRAMMEERISYGLELVQSLGGRMGDPVAAHVTMARHALLYTCRGDLTPEELVHAVELVYLPDGAPLPTSGRVEVLNANPEDVRPS